MAKTGDGEFELVLGNRQLLSVFFIVVILVAVFFTMGYVVGRNSSPGFEAKKIDRSPAAEASRPSAAVPANTTKAVAPPEPDTSAASIPTKEPETVAPARKEPEKRAEPSEAAA